MTNENFQKVNVLQQKWEADKKQALLKLKEEIELRNKRIQELEKNEKRTMSDKDKYESYARQNKEIQEKLKSLTADRDIIENEKKYLDEKIRKYEEKITDMEYQIKKK